RDRGVIDVDAVDEAEVVDVQRDLGVKALADRADDLLAGDGSAAVRDLGARGRGPQSGGRLVLHDRALPTVHAADGVSEAPPGGGASPATTAARWARVTASPRSIAVRTSAISRRRSRSSRT